MASSQAAFDEAVATIDRALGLESRWKDAGRSDDELLEQILRLYQQSVQRLDESMGSGALNESETAKLSAKRDEVAGRIKTLEVQRGPRLRSGSGNAYKDAVATLKDAATMDSRAKKGEPHLLVDTVRLYSHAIRLMLRAAQDPNCKQEVQRVMEQKIVWMRGSESRSSPPGQMTPRIYGRHWTGTLQNLQTWLLQSRTLKQNL